MQQSISPKVAALLIAVVVLVAGIFGYKMLSKGRGSSGKPPPEAEKYLKGLLKAQPGFSSAYGELKRFYLKTNRLADAEEILKSGAANLPDRQNEFLAQLAELYQKTGRRADMTRTLERLKSQASNSPSA